MKQKYEIWKKFISSRSLKKDEDLEISQKKKCPNCHQHTLEIITVQLRSLDEGQSILERCNGCNYNRNIMS